jgi:cytochrome P450
MNTKAIVSYSRQLLSSYKHQVITIGKQMLPQKKEVLFIFGGRAQHWIGIGSELYYSEKIFQQYIQKCDGILRELGENSILPNFEKKATADFFENESNVIFTLTSFQIALFELLKSKNIFPNAVMGISLGEVGAVYAAGGLSLKDAMIAVSIATITKKEKKEFIVLHVQTSFANAKNILKKSPVALFLIYEVTEQSVLVFCHKDHQNSAGEFLNSHNLAWHVPFTDLSYPYHTERIVHHEQSLKEFTKDIEPKPLRCNFYSSISGKMFPEGTILENEFWFKLKHQPVLTHLILKEMAASSYEVLLHIGAPSFLEKHLVQKSKSGRKRIKMLYTLRPGQPEVKLFKETEYRLIKIKKQRSDLLDYRNNATEKFKEKLDFHKPHFYSDSLIYLRHLQKEGSVHFLPKQKEWIVLNFNDIEYVLKTPEIFSSAIHKSFDEFLLGADPPSHTVVRSLMQPLFSQNRLNNIAEFTSAKSLELLNAVEHKKKFNFVNEFSIPLAQSVIGRFMGFTEEEGTAVINCMQGHPYEMRYLDALKEFCKQYLENLKVPNSNTVGGILLAFAGNGTIAFDAAVSLMRMLWVAGTTTSSMLMSTAVFLLSQKPQLIQKLKGDEQLLNKFFEECLRLDAPESEARRITTCETKLGNHILPAGAMVSLMLRAANRDPEYFDDPDNVLLNRTVKKHLSFGGGYHYCLGAGMARIEVKTAIKRILEKFSVIKICANETEYFPSSHFRGLSNLSIVQETIDKL